MNDVIASHRAWPSAAVEGEVSWAEVFVGDWHREVEQSLRGIHSTPIRPASSMEARSNQATAVIALLVRSILQVLPAVTIDRRWPDVRTAKARLDLLQELRQNLVTRKHKAYRRQHVFSILGER